MDNSLVLFVSSKTPSQGSEGNEEEKVGWWRKPHGL